MHSLTPWVAGIIAGLLAGGAAAQDPVELYRWQWDGTGNAEHWNMRPWGAVAPGNYVYQADSFTWTTTPPNCPSDCTNPVFVNLMGRDPAQWPWDNTHPARGGALAIESSDDCGLYLADGVKASLNLPADKDVTGIEFNVTTSGSGGTRWVDFYLLGDQPGTWIRLRATNLNGWGNNAWSPWKWRRTSYTVGDFRNMQFVVGNGMTAADRQNIANLNKLYAVNLVGNLGTSAGHPIYLDDVRLYGTPDSPGPNLLANGRFENLPGNTQIWTGNYARDPGVNPVPPRIDGEQAWSNTRGEVGTETTTTRQAALVTPGSAVLLTGYADCNAAGAGSSGTILVSLTDGPGGPVIQSRSITQDTPATDAAGLTGSWVRVQLGGTCSSGVAVVEFTTELTSCGDAPTCQASAYLDAFTLTSSTPCTAQPSLGGSAVSPAQAPASADLPMTITGSNLDEVTAVRLAQIESGADVAGTVTAHSNGLLSVLFPLGTANAPPGQYNVVIQKRDCSPQIALDAVVLSPAGVNLLQNTGLEEDAAPANGWPDYWDQAGNAEWPAPGWYFGAGPHSGNRALGAASNTGLNEGYVEQAVGLPEGPGGYDLNLSLWAWIYDNGHYGSEVTAEIVVDGVVVASKTLGNAGLGTMAYRNLVVPWSGTANTGITARVTCRGDGRGANGWGVAVADDVQLFLVRPDCHVPYADADGDGDVDQLDFAALQLCYNGGGGTTGGAAGNGYPCACFDRGGSSRSVDNSDIVSFVFCESGPGVAWVPTPMCP